MSVQFGRWSFDGMPPLPDLLESVNTVLAPYGPDSSNSYHKDGISILYSAFHTTKESRREMQPYISHSGVVITWDGRLDNRAEFAHRFNDSLSIDSADVTIVAAAYELWGTNCFGKLIGDWTLSIWNPNERSLILAKDAIGARQLYYFVQKEQIAWSTILDPLLVFTRKTLELDEEYIAGYFSLFPAPHLTPYVGINSVPPSCFVRLEWGQQSISKYWDFDPSKTIRYRTDSEYEEHFRTVFTQAVQRRLRSDSPILAELSGGMDSSSIVCTADAIINRGATEPPRLDTLSYFNDSEPNWNERPYFTSVEEKRGRTGFHIDVGTQGSFKREFGKGTFATTPGSDGGQVTEATRQFTAHMISQGYRVVLSGIGGDEFTGGVPTPMPELMDLMARGRLKAIVRQLQAWALNKRKPWFHLLFEAARAFFPVWLVGIPKHMRPAVWLHPDFVKRQKSALSGYPSRVNLFGPLPSFQDNVSTLDVLRRQLACSPLSANPIYEKRYPFLDRTFLEFIYAIPREQLVRPGQRRSLMRRALVGTVPNQLLNRKRKAFVARSLMTAISKECTDLVGMSDQMTSVSLGIVDTKAFCEVLQRAHQGQQVPIVALLRTMTIESWLRSARAQRSSKDGALTAAATEPLPLDIAEH